MREIWTKNGIEYQWQKYSVKIWVCNQPHNCKHPNIWLVSEWWNVWYWSTDVKLLIGILLISDATRYIAFFNLVCKRKLGFFLHTCLIWNRQTHRLLIIRTFCHATQSDSKTIILFKIFPIADKQQKYHILLVKQSILSTLWTVNGVSGKALTVHSQRRR